MITDYTYDKLNRPVTRIYSTQSSDPVAIAAAAASPKVTFYYDNQALPSGGPAGFSRGSAWGRLVAVTYGSGGTQIGSFYGHDIAGRVTSSVQLTTSDAGGPVIYAFSYEYSVGGQLKKETYPSGRVVEHTYDDAGRMNLVMGTVNGSVTTFAQSFQYTPHGAVQQYQQGNALWAHTKFNSRLQVERIGLGKSSSMETTDAVSALRLGYNYGATTNNGNLQSQEITVNATTTPTVITQTYAYDEVSRLTSYNENSALAQSYGYDACGNRWVTSSPVPELIPVSQSHYSSSSNRINMTGYPYGYDLAGNITAMPQIPEAPLNRTLNYDGENRIVSTKLGSGGALDYYYYDGEGRRIRKKVTGVETVFVYDASGRLVAEYSSAPPTANTRGTRYLTADHLGSTRLVTTGGAGNVKERYDYRPFGEELGAGIGGRTISMGYSSASETLKQKFAGYERDNETSLDFAQARYFSSTQGRFTSPDEPFAGQDEEDPQTWNLYAYTSNNPLNRIDPDGRRWFSKQGEVPIWVNPNDDGTYTSPGEGWQEFIPTKENPHLTIKSADGTTAYLFGEQRDGSPIAFALQTGMVRDASWDIVGLFIPGRISVKGILAGATALWGKHLAKEAAKEAAEEAIVTAARRVPVGRLGSPMKVAPKTNVPAVIGGRRYQGHALDQMQSRGLTPSVVEDTIARGVKTPGRNGATVHTTEQARVVLNPNGSVKTVMPYSRK